MVEVESSREVPIASGRFPMVVVEQSRAVRGRVFQTQLRTLGRP